MKIKLSKFVVELGEGLEDLVELLEERADREKDKKLPIKNRAGGKLTEAW